MMKLTSSGKLIIPAEKTVPAPPEPPTNPATPRRPPPSPEPGAEARGSTPLAGPAQEKPAPAKINWHEMPEIEVVTDADLERVKLETEAKRRREMVGMFKIGGYCLLGVLVLALALETARYAFNGRPSEEAMTQTKADVAAQVLRRFTTGEQPLEVAEVVAEEVDSARGRVEYEMRVTLRLREPLYGPADSNGAQPYLILLRSLADAQALVLQQRLFLDDVEMATAPQLPVLLAVTHRAGERRVVRVPVTAAQTMWTWRLTPVLERARMSGAGFTGQALVRYANTRYLLFGTTEARDRMRQGMAEARNFILRVNAEHSRRVREGTQ